jgi:hypothetical protein
MPIATPVEQAGILAEWATYADLQTALDPSLASHYEDVGYQMYNLFHDHVEGKISEETFVSAYNQLSDQAENPGLGLGGVLLIGGGLTAAAIIGYFLVKGAK